MYKLANELFQAIEDGFSNIEQIKTGSKGNIKLTAECQSFFHDLPAFIQKMGILYPEINIDLSLGTTHQTIAQILSDEIDIALVTTQPNMEELSSIEIFEDEIFALIHQENPLHQKLHISASDFLETHLIINSFPLEGVAVYEHFLRPSKVTPIKISAIPFTEISLEMVKANMGIMCLPKWQLNSFKLSEELVFKRIGKYGLKRKHYLVIKKANRNKKYINDFILNFEETFLQQRL